MEQFANNAQSTLASGINSGAASLTVQSAVGFSSSGNFRLMVDNEIMLVTGVAGNVFTVTRGQEGTSAIAHSTGACVTEVLTAGALTQLKEDVAPTEASGIAAAGTTQGGATALSADNNEVTSMTEGSQEGVRLPDRAGASIFIRMASAGDLRIYPPTGAKIDALSTNAPYHTNGTVSALLLSRVSSSQWYASPIA